MEWISTAYWICLAVGLVYTVISFTLGEIAGTIGHIGDLGGANTGDFSHNYGVAGAGHGEALDTDTAGGSVIFGPFSPLVIAFFLTCFGITGLLLTKMGFFWLFSLPGAAASGFILAWLLILFFNRVLGSMQSSSEVRLHSLIGEEAEVTVAIPPTGVGEIAFVAMGARSVTPARSENQAAIPRYAAVRITRIVGNTFFVSPSEVEENNDIPPSEVGAASE